MSDANVKPLMLTVVRATGLQAAGTVDSYVVLRHPSFGELRTSVVKGSVAPEYDEPFLCGMTPAQMEVPIEARVLASSYAAEDPVIGAASIDVRALTDAARVDPTVTLARAGAAHAGTLSISVVDRGHPATLLARGGAEVDDVAAWNARVEAEIEVHGFDAAWRKHLPEIVYLHQTGADKGGLVGQQLYHWMKKDPELAGHFDALPLLDKAELDASMLQGAERVIEDVEALRPGRLLDEAREAVDRVVAHDEILEGTEPGWSDPPSALPELGAHRREPAGAHLPAEDEAGGHEPGQVGREARQEGARGGLPAHVGVAVRGRRRGARRVPAAAGGRAPAGRAPADRSERPDAGDRHRGRREGALPHRRGDHERAVPAVVPRERRAEVGVDRAPERDRRWRSPGAAATAPSATARACATRR